MMMVMMMMMMKTTTTTMMTMMTTTMTMMIIVKSKGNGTHMLCKSKIMIVKSKDDTPDIDDDMCVLLKVNDDAYLLMFKGNNTHSLSQKLVDVLTFKCLYM